MRNRMLAVIVAVSLAGAGGQVALGQGGGKGFFVGQDLHLAADEMIVHSEEDGSRHVMVFENNFTMSVGDNRLRSEGAVVWLETVSTEYLGVVNVDYRSKIYLHGGVSVEQGIAARTTDMTQLVVEHGQSLVAGFTVTGQVFATAETQKRVSLSEIEELQIYKLALAAMTPIRDEPTIAQEAIAPGTEELLPKKEAVRPGAEEPVKPGIETEIPPVQEPKFEYPVSLSNVLGSRPEFEQTVAKDETSVVTIIGRFYLWQKRDEEGGLLEFQADSAVVFYGGERFKVSDDEQEDNVLAGGVIDAIYLSGNIVMTEGERTIRADEAYYDFRQRQALIVKAEMRNFDTKRGLPIYLRAEKLKQVTDNVYDADDITLTTSEFYLPQISITAFRMVLTDTTGVDMREGKEVEDSSYDGVLYETRMKMGKSTFFYWPKFRTDFRRPDVPIRKIEFGRDSNLGTFTETRWYLFRLLGKKKPEGVEADLALDYYSKRGEGAGVSVEYEREDYYGDVIAYILKNRGEDDLGRTSDRKNVDPGEDIRGRFKFQHRHYLPYDWQATIETSYTSDRNFVEWFYRNEFDTGKAQETLVHLKRLKDNWAFVMLGKLRINDYETMTEELPTVEFHLKGESFWDDKLTFYSDTQLSRFRDRDDSEGTKNTPSQFYSFATTRNEVDMPFMWKTVKAVPFVAATYALEDQGGFYTRLDGGSVNKEEEVLLGEGGLRLATMFWKEDNSIKSERWDIDGIRHIVQPHLETIHYLDNEKSVEMRDVINYGISQRWQTHRGEGDKRRSLDWMRLNINMTQLSDDSDSSMGSAGPPANFIWNNPAIPILTRRGSSRFGMLRESVNADYVWRLSDTSTILSDINYDIKTGVVQQFNMGLARYVYPDISYYIGSRYLRPVIISVPSDGVYEKGSHSVLGAITYALNQRYTVAFSQEYNFDYGKNVKSELAIIRRYHRLFCGLIFSTDKSRDNSMISIAIWPQGIKDMGVGSREYYQISEMYSGD